MFWEAVMETGEFRRPSPPSRVLVVSEQRERVREKESLTALNVFSNPGENRPPSQLIHTPAGPLTEALSSGGQGREIKVG